MVGLLSNTGLVLSKLFAFRSQLRESVSTEQAISLFESTQKVFNRIAPLHRYGEAYVVSANAAEGGREGKSTTLSSSSAPPSRKQSMRVVTQR